MCVQNNVVATKWVNFYMLTQDFKNYEIRTDHTHLIIHTHQSLNGPVSILTRFSNHQLVSLTCFNVAKYSSNRHQSTYKIRHIVHCHLVSLLSVLITLRGRHLDKHPSMHLTCNHKIICINFKSISFLELFRRCQ